MISPKERRILRALAGQVAELAALPEQERKRVLWYRHNALEPTRPVIFCDPEGGWREIVRDADLECSTDLARFWERQFRQLTFWGASMGDDRVIEPVLSVGWTAARTGFGIEEERRPSDQEFGAYAIGTALKTYDDVERLHPDTITVDREATDRALDVAHTIFDGLLEVRLKAGWWWSLGMTWEAIRLRGLEQFMLDMYDEPEGLHRLMAFLRDNNLRMLDFLEQNRFLSQNADDTYVGSGGFGYCRELPQPDFDGARVRTMDMWGFCESQETVGVSPELFEEFVFRYQLPILERFGLNCYGCCEPIDKRWHVVRQVPRLRRVSVSAWADLEDMAAKLGDAFIYSMKPNPADLARPELDEDRVRQGLRRALGITRGCRVEVIMKDCHTIGNNPDNVVRWSRIAREEAERAAT